MAPTVEARGGTAIGIIDYVTDRLKTALFLLKKYMVLSLFNRNEAKILS